MANTFVSKLKNWWWYHKKAVLIVLVVIAVVAYLTWQDNHADEPDYHVGLVSTTAFSPEQLSQMEDSLCAAGEDLNGDGQILIQLHTYRVDLADESPNAGYNHYEIVAALDGDLVGNVSGIFLLDDPETFQRITEGKLAETVIPWEYGLFLTIREDADAAYTELFNSFQ